MKIRDATDADLVSILDIYNDAIAHTTAVFDDTPHALDMRREWLVGKYEAALPVLVAIDAENVVGFGTYGPFRPWPAYKYSVEHSVYVHPMVRRRGVGIALVRAIIDNATSRGLHTIVAGITAENTASLRLHTPLGFREVGRLIEVGFKFGRWLDLTFLQLPLQGGFPRPQSKRQPTRQEPRTPAERLAGHLWQLRLRACPASLEGAP